jgi:two-component system cell cycle sensor histidine kinase/response regulator CckA
VRLIVARMVSLLGYEALTAANGDEALDVAERVLDRLDLLLTDVRMPGMQGPQLARRLRELRPDLPVLLMSGLADEAADMLTGDTRDLRLLPKPFSREELGKALSETLADAR